MDKKIIFGILPNTESLESLLNNFEEVDFDTHDISVVMKNNREARIYIDDYGPLMGADIKNLNNLLIQHGISSDDAIDYLESIEKHAVLLAISIDPVAQDVAVDMLKDYDVQDIIIV